MGGGGGGSCFGGVVGMVGFGEVGGVVGEGRGVEMVVVGVVFFCVGVGDFVFGFVWKGGVVGGVLVVDFLICWVLLGFFFVEVVILVVEVVLFVFGFVVGGIIFRGVGDDGDGMLGEEIGVGVVERVG